jgi:DNA-binding MarR family transcriptional regulator
MDQMPKIVRPEDPAVQRTGRFSVWFSLISRALSQHMLDYVRREFGLNLAEYRTLTVLAESRSASIREIAAGTQFDKAQVTRAVASLTRRGLAIHTVDGRDRRLRVVKPTPAGRALVARMLPFSIARQKRLEQTLTAMELRVVWKALAALSDEAQTMLAEAAEMSAKQKRGGFEDKR